MITTAERSALSSAQIRWDFQVERSIRESGDVSARMTRALLELACEVAADAIGVEREELQMDDSDTIHLVRHNFVKLVLESEVVGLTGEQADRHRAAGGFRKLT